MKWIDKLERRYRRFGIPNLMKGIVILTAVVFVLDMFLVSAGGNFSYYLEFNTHEILKGQVWRILSFVLIPPPSSPIFIIFALYFYYMIGSSLENQWGAFKFTLYYIIGMLGTMLGAIIANSSANAIYLNLSMFFAFAMLFPNFKILLFFILPVKMKYLAYVNAAFFAFQFIIGGIGVKTSIIASLLNFFLFFYNDFIDKIKFYLKYKDRRREFWKKNNFRNRF